MAETRNTLAVPMIKGGVKMARRGVMSDALKVEIAKELGFYDVVQREGWGGIKARDAGNMVKRAIQMAEAQVSQGQK
jgi:small acid-soluble spore protein F (minor alpha/beta-type SASP)